MSNKTMNEDNLLQNWHPVGAYCRTSSSVPAQEDDQGLPLEVSSYTVETDVDSMRCNDGLYEGPVLDATTGVVMKNQVANVTNEKFVRPLLKDTFGITG